MVVSGGLVSAQGSVATRRDLVQSQKGKGRGSLPVVGLIAKFRFATPSKPSALLVAIRLALRL